MTNRTTQTTTNPDVELALKLGKPEGGWRLDLYRIIFESDTPAGRRFDRWLVAIILASIFVVMLDSVPSIGNRYPFTMRVLEWGFTAIFTVEYAFRLLCVKRPWHYARSFFGIIDLLSILPLYFSVFYPEAAALLDIRILRLLRVFRIFKLTLYVNEYTALGHALAASRRKILVFISVVLMLALVLGTLMYVVEGPENKFTSIPTSVYWAIVTMTTVGYGDITPVTPLGKGIATIMMLLGWGILAVPTGIVTAEMTNLRLGRRGQERACDGCGASGLAPDARFCDQCGAPLVK
jgi:voltage-gated potassium channel